MIVINKEVDMRRK